MAIYTEPVKRSVQRTMIVNISFVKEQLEGGVATCKILALLAPSNKLFIYAELSKNI